MIYYFKDDHFAKETNVKHYFFSRLGGVSSGDFASLNCGMSKGDDEANVKENKRIISEELGIQPSNLLFLRQNHTKLSVTVDQLWDAEHRPEADGMATNKKGVALAIITADCAPVLFADAKAGVIGACHAGWRGALDGVMEATIRTMCEIGASTSNIEAIVGPCIGHHSYEVGIDFREAFFSGDKTSAKFFTDSKVKDKWLFNLPGYVVDRLKRAGIDKVTDIQQDTVVNDKFFFSNRRNFLLSRKTYGLQPSIIMMKE